MLKKRDPDLAARPNKYAHPNGLVLDGQAALFSGYQEFSFEPRNKALRAIGDALAQKEKLVESVFTPRYMSGRTILDLGGNNGFFSFKALLSGASTATVVDLDAECITNLNRAKSHFLELPIRAQNQNIDQWSDPADVVLAFALVHWIYSCTSRILSLDGIVERLANLTRDFLVVEWVDPADPLVQGFYHTETQEGAKAQPYTFHDFISALSSQFSSVELLGEISPTRRIFLATKRTLPDFSWEAPLVFPRDTVISSSQLWSCNENKFWSRVYKLDGYIYKQCIPPLAEREVKGAAVLGEKFDILEQHESWWLLRRPYVDGESLDERMAREHLSHEGVLRLLLGLVEIVSRLCEAGIVHRDLHPINVILDMTDKPHLIDFGWATFPGTYDFTPPYLGADVFLPATRTTISIRPPEGTGNDLYAIGQIARWFCRTESTSPAIRFLGEWLGHQNYDFRLRDAESARRYIERMLEDTAGRDSIAPPILENEFFRIAEDALKAVAIIEREAQVQEAASRTEVSRLRAECAAASAERDAARASAENRAREIALLQQELIQARNDRDSVQGQLHLLKNSIGLRFINCGKKLPGAYRAYLKAKRLYQGP